MSAKESIHFPCGVKIKNPFVSIPYYPGGRKIIAPEFKFSPFSPGKP
jgi:hypothetical protein